MTDKENTFASLEGKTAVVTGASSGIGRAIALEFARAGANLIIHYANSSDAAEQVAAAAESRGVQARTLQANFAEGGFAEFSTAAWETFSGVDVLVNNAGVDLLTGAAAKLDFGTKLEQLFAVDVASAIHLSRQFGEKMKERGAGAILNVGWDQADRGMEGDSAELFSASKNAIMGFTRSVAVSLAPQVRVNCIAPGWIQTAWGEQASEEWQARVIRETPLQRWGQPEDIARLARFLVSSEADYLTGQVINANGGAIR